jgi:hypothetical protein
MYGSHTAMFRVIRDLKLIDIAHSSFYSILKNKIREATNNDQTLRNIHPLLLYPLGFDDKDAYKEFTRLLNINIHSTNVSLNIESELYFNNRSRLSVHSIDVLLMEFLNREFGTQPDGIICDTRFPNILSNGYQPPELSIFTQNDVVHAGEYSRHVIGGNKLLNNSFFYNATIVLPITPEQESPIVTQYVKFTRDIIHKLPFAKPDPSLTFHISPLITPISTITKEGKYNGW